MEKFNGNSDLDAINTKKPRVLVVPLDWGLGHATRCIPIIHELLQQNADVWLAGEGKQETILRKEFKDLPFLHLPGYRVKYGRSSFDLLKNIIIQTPRIIKTIRQEHQWLKKAVTEHGFNAVISDNRYGLYHESIPSIFITHQLMIKTPFGKWADNIVQKRNYKYINCFSGCWIPDNEKTGLLAQDLSHPVKKPDIPLLYIGPLSRLKKNNILEKKNHLFISLSGPEPQRTLLEDKIIKDISHYPGTATIARGLPGTAGIIPSTNDIKFYNHIPTAEYNKEMEMAEYVISRSGYSTIMDIMALGKKSILVPTPGQTEQEYLAKHLFHTKRAYCIPQKIFLLPEALKNAQQFDYEISGQKIDTGLVIAVKSLISKLSLEASC